jgi:transcriptional regulator with XRE-family HTH domain
MAIPIGPLVRKYRERHRMTQQDLVDFTGLDRSASYFSSIETGRTSPTLAELEAIARVFRTTVVDFILEAGDASAGTSRREGGSTPPPVRGVERPESDRALDLLESLSDSGRAMALELLDLMVERERRGGMRG